LLTKAASSPAACPPGPALYRPRRPERTLLHRLVREHLETFLDLAGAGRVEMGLAAGEARPGHLKITPVPRYVETAFRRYLECGVPAYGVARARCNACGYDFFVAFSCQLRGVCPSCNTRRMVETAARLADQVLPKVPRRQWVFSVPKRVRCFLRHEGETVGGVLGIFMRASKKWSMPIQDWPAALNYFSIVFGERVPV